VERPRRSHISHVEHSGIACWYARSPLSCKHPSRIFSFLVWKGKKLQPYKTANFLAPFSPKSPISKTPQGPYFGRKNFWNTGSRKWLANTCWILISYLLTLKKLEIILGSLPPLRPTLPAISIFGIKVKVYFVHRLPQLFDQSILSFEFSTFLIASIDLEDTVQLRGNILLYASTKESIVPIYPPAIRRDIEF